MMLCDSASCSISKNENENEGEAIIDSRQPWLAVNKRKKLTKTRYM